MKKEVVNYLLIIMGSIMYAIFTVLFIFPHALLLGGTSGISVILNEYLKFSPGTILMVINFFAADSCFCRFRQRDGGKNPCRIHFDNCFYRTF